AGFNVNRRLRTPQGMQMRPNPEGVVDREVLVVRLDRASQEAAEPLAVLFRYTCHATAMGAQNYQITADYPGAAAAFVEGAYGGRTVALFLQGCTGDVRPHLISAQGAFRSATWEELAGLGRAVGGAAVAAAEQSRPVVPPDDAPGGAELAVAGRIVDLPSAPLQPGDELSHALDAGRWPDGRPVTEAERHWAGRVLEALRDGREPEGVPAEVQVFRLGEQWLVCLPGEVFVEIGWRVRDAVAGAAGVPAAQVVVAAYANGNVGYVPTAAAIPEGGYEVTAYRHAGRLAGYAPQAEEILARTAADLAASLR
ncbi:MAG TPA: hypothetical protein VHS99_27835, partial [Chloroflexota bacterium]|nr:hypothetical protein [Chloroflexota bacterium]